MRLWIKTSQDKYRLIEDMDVNAQLLAERNGISVSTIYSNEKYHRNKGVDTRYMSIEIGDEDGECEEAAAGAV